MGNITYSYFFGSVLLVTIWTIFFIWRKDLRKEMLIMGLLFSIFGLTGAFYDTIYWNPTRIWILPGVGVGIEDFLYMFSLGGIGSVSYEVLFHMFHKKTRSDSILEVRKTQILLSIVTGFATILYLATYTEMGILLVHTVGILVIAISLIFFEKRLLYPMVVNFFIFGLIVILVEVVTGYFFPGFQNLWIESKILGPRILGYPIEEFIFHGAWGAAVSCVYEFYLGLKDSK